MERERRARTSARAARIARAGRGLALAALLGAVPGAAAALDCPAPPGASPALAAIPAERRIAFLRARLDAARHGTEAWSRTWAAANGAIAVGQLVAIPLTPGRGDRWLLGAGAATSAAGVVEVLTLPIVPGPARAGPDACPELARLEADVGRSARNARLGSGLAAQLGNLAVNGAFGAAARLVDGRWSTAAWTFALGFALGETQILTLPTGLVRDLGRYRAGELDAAPGGGTASAPAARAIAVPIRGGAMVAVAGSL